MGSGHVTTTVEAITIFAPSVWPFFQPGEIKHIGGAEKQVYSLAGMMADYGVRVHLLTINLGARPAKLPANLVVVGTWTTGSSLLAKGFGLIRRIVTAREPVYVRSPSLVNGLVVFLGRMLRKRVVLGLASDLSCIRLPGKKFRNFVISATLKLSSEIVAQTQDQQRLLSEHFGVNAIVFNNVVALRSYEGSRAASFEDRHIDVVWVGSIEPRKGLEDVMEIASLLPENSFSLIGTSPPGQDRYLRSVSKRLAEHPNVTIEGFVTPEALPPRMADCKLLLHTSRPVVGNLTKEGFPNVFLEAWASGVVVVSLHADPDQLLSSEKLGLRCSSLGEAEAAIRRLTRDEEAWNSIRREADRYVKGRDVGSRSVQEEFLSILAGTRH